MGTNIKTKNAPLPPQNPKERSQALSLLIGCMKFLFPKQFVTIFNLE
jgi:hypothetical protein